MNYREVSEVRDGMRIDWDVPITMEDGLVLRADVFRPIKDGKYPGAPELRPLRQVAALRGRLQDRLEPDGGNPSRRDRGLDQPLPELGSVRPGEVGAGRLCLPARRLARLRPHPRPCRALVAARSEGLRPMRRVGGNAGLVERQGGPERHLVLRDEPVAGRVIAAEASRRAVRLGRRGRLLPRPQPPRRHLLHVCPELVRHADQDRAVRPRHQGPPQPHERRLGVRPRHADLRGDGQQSLRSRTDLLPARARRRILEGDDARLHQDQRAAAVECELGRQRAAPARQFRGLIRARPPSRSGWKCTASSTGPTTTPTTASQFRRSSSATSSRARTTAGTRSPRCACRCAIRGKNSSSATRTNGRSRARNGPSTTSTPTLGCRPKHRAEAGR